MRSVLVTGGTVFVSRYVAEYFVKKGDNVYVLNRNTRPQSEGVTLIEADRHNLGDTLRKYHFDLVLDVTAYTKTDIESLVNALDNIDQYIFISSSAVYPETLEQPFSEEQECGPNSVWGAYGINKLEAEKYLLDKVSQAYILRPPYLYGPMQNVYREPFVFDCADADRPFYIPKDGSMPLQFFHVEDLCRFIDIILEKQPENHIFNVGNPEVVTINEWVKMCYQVAGKEARLVNVDASHQQRDYFSFYDYAYELDVTKQNNLMPDTKPLLEGLQESYQWYQKNSDLVNTKPYFDYIDQLEGAKMKNPWEEIGLSDYENHMKLDSVLQLQTMNAMMKEQFYQYPVKTIMVLGIAGGNGLEHINPQMIEKVYGVDINKEYLKECSARYPQLSGILNPLCIDLMDDGITLPHADLVVADLLIEYIGYECFKRVISQIQPQYVSCVIQINIDAGFVSDSPYIHVFDHLDSVHHQMDEQSLVDTMESIKYSLMLKNEKLLPNGKKLVRLDFKS